MQEKEIYSDPSAWLILCICAYIKESGDIDFLNEKIPFVDGNPDTVYKHLLYGINWYMSSENIGVNGLPKIHQADWNDALNIPDNNSESVFMGMLVCSVLKEMNELSTYIGDLETASKCNKFYKDLADKVNKVAWNGDYYVRAISKYGIVGDKDNLYGGNIYINPQSWSIISGIVPKERIEKILNVIDNTETEYGLPLCYPPYTEYDKSVGRMSSMPAGVFENGGIYNHACAFKIIADCLVDGRGENAVNTLLKMIPDGKNNPSEITTTEPYVFTNCYSMHTSEKMMVAFSWQTGSSAWALRDYYEGILGLQRGYDGLHICPALPKDWKTVEAQRYYRGNKLNIHYINDCGTNITLMVDGKNIVGNVVPLFEDNNEHEIIVVLK